MAIILAIDPSFAYSHELCEDLAVNDHRKRRAEDLCRAINERLGWRGADPEFVDRGYTGRVVLSARAAEDVAGALEASSKRAAQSK